MDCSSPGSSLNGILQARRLEWVAIPFSRGSSQLRIELGSPALQADSLASEPPGKIPILSPSWWDCHNPGVSLKSMSEGVSSPFE